MKIALKVRHAAVVCGALAIPVAAMAQYSGVSRPEQVPITTSPEGIQQPVMYESTPGLKVRTNVAANVQPAEVAAPAMSALPVAPPAKAVAATTASAELVSASDVAEVRPDVDAGVVTRVAGPSNQLPIGTLVRVSLASELSTRTTALGSTFTAHLTEAVERDGKVLLPRGSVLSGMVTDVHGGKRITGAASIHLRPNSVTLPDGTRYALHGQVIDTQLYDSTKVDREGTILRKDHAGKTAAAMTLTTGSAAAAGAVFGGVPGAVIGAGVGAGVSTAVWLKQDRQTDLPAGTKITFALNEPMLVGAQ